MQSSIMRPERETGEPKALTGESPVDGRPLTPIDTATPRDVVRAVSRARAAQPGWAAMHPSERSAALERAAKRMLDDRATILAILGQEIGKFEVDGLFSEALGPLDVVKQWSKIVKKGLAPKRVFLNPVGFPGKKASHRLVPRGVIGCITPWNYPIATFFRPVIPALLCGNSVVIKPSEHAPRAANWFLSHLEAELPEGVVQMVHGRGDVGAALIGAGIDACTFTGSVATGKKVAAMCAEQLIPVSVELGGKDPAIVLEDADLTRTAAGIAHWSLHNAGQACAAIEVVLVQRSIADALVQRLASGFERLKVGSGRFAETDVSPLAIRAQLETVERHVKDAIHKGATLVTGGERTGEGLGYRPTILDGCTEDMLVVSEETFGPVLAIVRVDGVEDAIRMVNASLYGLTASIWSSDLARAERIGERLDVGTVTINNHSVTGAMTALPWSGTRGTGPGIANSLYALTLFCRPKSLLVDDNRGPDPFWLPFDRSLYDLGDLLADAMLGRIGQAFRIPFLALGRANTIKRFWSVTSRTE
jgi:succinate-semialdehyde dehydrogenase/glutarate-semialdehyde dehydrogenase